MPRPPSLHPTDGELEILRVLWEHGASTLGTICEALRANARWPPQRSPRCSASCSTRASSAAS